MNMNTYNGGVILNPSQAGEYRTYAFFGLERGGTSPVAGIARALGLYMGENLGTNNEDPRFIRKPVRKVKDTIENINSRHKIWGWKYPRLGIDLPVLLKHLRNPHLIVIARDPVAAAMSNLRWNIELRRPIGISIVEALSYNTLNLGIVLNSGCPALLVSAEKFKDDLNDSINMIADFLCFNRPGDELRGRILAYLEGNKYKKFEDFFGPNTEGGASVSAAGAGATA